MKTPTSDIKVKEMSIRKSLINKGLFCLIIKTEDGNEWVCNGDHWNPTYLIPIEDSFDFNKK